MGCKILFVNVQPPIAKARTLCSHVACIGFEIALAIAEDIDYRRTLNHPHHRSIDYLLSSLIPKEKTAGGGSEKP
jgi:hypothetical protein